MAISSTVSAHDLAGRRRSVFSAPLARFRAWRAEWREVDQISTELHAYSDSALAELGLMRSDIPDVARGRFRRA